MEQKIILLGACCSEATSPAHSGHCCCLQVRYWGLWMTVVLLFTALVTPFEISFLKQHINGEHPQACRLSRLSEL